MLIYLAKALLFICLFMIFIQDHKDRAVHILFFLGVCLSSICVFLIQNGDVTIIVMSLFFLVANLILLKLYMRVRKIEMSQDLFWGGIAIGDIVFLLVVIPLFSFHSYAIFFISGMIFSILTHLLFKKVGFDAKETVPLAGYLSIFLILILVVSSILEIDLYKNIV